MEFQQCYLVVGNSDFPLQRPEASADKHTLNTREKRSGERGRARGVEKTFRSLRERFAEGLKAFSQKKQWRGESLQQRKRGCRRGSGMKEARPTQFAV